MSGYFNKVGLRLESRDAQITDPILLAERNFLVSHPNFECIMTVFKLLTVLSHLRIKGNMFDRELKLINPDLTQHDIDKIKLVSKVWDDTDISLSPFVLVLWQIILKHS